MSLTDAKIGEVRFIVASALSERDAHQVAFLEAIGRHLADIQAHVMRLEALIGMIELVDDDEEPSIINGLS